MKSFVHRGNFKTQTLRRFKETVKNLNSNFKKTQVKDKAVLRAEKLKHDQNKRASEKRGLPRFDMDMAKRLLEGKFHEMEEEEEGEEGVPKVQAVMDPGKTMFAQSREEIAH